MKKRIGILCHGFDPRDPDWKTLVWGNPLHGLFGRVPTAIRIAFELNAEMLLLPAGKWPNSGVDASSVYAWHYICQHGDELAGALDMNVSVMQSRLERIIELEQTALTTREEIERAGEIFLNRSIEQPVQVSSPFHLPRAHRTGMEIWKEKKYRGLQSPWAIPAQSDAPGRAAKDVLIFEPADPHYKEAQALQAVRTPIRKE